MNIRTTSGSLTVNIHQPIDLEILYEYLQLDTRVEGIKFGDLRRGKTSLTNAFYNQLTLYCFFNKTITVKLFKNGNMNVTGITSKNQGIEVIMYIIDKITTIQGEKEVEVIVNKGIFYDKRDVDMYEASQTVISTTKSKPSHPIKIYSVEDQEIHVIGFKSKDTFYLSRQKATLYMKWFLVKQDYLTFHVYSLQGQRLGTAVDTFTQKYKTNVSNRYQHNIANNSEIHFLTDTGKYRGKRVFDFDISQTPEYPMGLHVFQRKFKCIEKEIEELEVTSCFLNFQDDLGNPLNKSVLQTFFQRKGWDSVHQMVGKVSKVILSLNSYEDMPPFNTIKFVFYSSGKVNIHSSSDKETVEAVYHKLVQLMKGYPPLFYEGGIVVTNENINITDIM